MNLLTRLCNRIEDRLYGQALWPDLRQLWNGISTPSRIRWRRFRQRLHRRLRPGLNWSYDGSIRRFRETEQSQLHGISEFRELQAAAPIPIDAAQPFAVRLHAWYPPTRPLTSRQVFVCRLQNPRLYLPEGLLVTRAGGFLVDSAFGNYRLPLSRVHGDPMPAKVPFLAGRYTSMWGLLDSNTYHWLVDGLMRLHSLEAACGPLTLLMPASASPYHHETLRFCLPDNIEIQFVENPGWIEVEEFEFPSYVTQGGCISVPATHSAALQQRVWKRLNLAPDHIGTRRIFISRRHALTRHILNEPEVMEALAPLGFESYRLEQLSFSEQVRLFHDAQIVVAPHGAGLTNMLFSPRLRVVELQTEQIALHYFFLAQSLGHSYTSVLSPSRHSPHFPVRVPDLLEKLAPLL